MGGEGDKRGMAGEGGERVGGVDCGLWILNISAGVADTCIRAGAELNPFVP